MASTMCDIKITKAEDISQYSCTQNNNLNSAPDLEQSVTSDTEVTNNKLTNMDPKINADSAADSSNNVNNMAQPFMRSQPDGNDESEQAQNDDRSSIEGQTVQDQTDGSNKAEDPTVQTNCLSGKVNYSFESDSDEDFCVLRRSRSDELLELKHHFQTKESSEALNDYPSPVSESNAKEYLELQKGYAYTTAKKCMTSPTRAGYPYNVSPTRAGYPYNTCSESPGTASEESDQYARARRESGESQSEERIRSIEEEYMQRISSLEDRHYELEDVLARLTSSLEPLFETPAPEEFKPEDVADAYACTEVDDDYTDDRTEEKAKIDELLFKTEQQKKRFARMIGLELFLEFQQKIRSFAVELNGVLNCSEAAIRHARVVQEWGSTVQVMFEEMKDERMKMQEFIDERERSVMIMRNQFASELQQQGRTLCHLVDDMKAYRDLYEAAEKYGGTMAPNISNKLHLGKNIVDFMLRQHADGEKALILDLKKQSKISEMKLLIIHQQSFIQQVQEQNRELRAIIEGLMGPEECASEMNDSEHSGTPGSLSSPGRSSLRQSLDKLLDKAMDTPVCKISDVLDCDRGETYPGTSTDGDIATIQTFEIGTDSKRIDPGEQIIYDPLTVSYVRDQCRAVEETERRHQVLEEQVDENKENIATDDGIQTFCDGINVLNIEPYLRKTAEKERDLDKADVVTNGPLLVGDREAGGDGTEALRTTKVPPGKSGKVTIVAEYDDDDDDDGVDVDDIDYIVDECEIIDDIPVAEPPIIDIENTNNNDDLD